MFCKGYINPKDVVLYPILLFLSKAYEPKTLLGFMRSPRKGDFWRGAIRSLWKVQLRKKLQCYG